MKRCTTAIIITMVLFTFISSFKSTKRSLHNNILRARSAVYASTMPYKTSIVNHPCYEKLETFSIDEYGLEGATYRHLKSGAQVMSINAPDDNKVFGITFRTPPSDSTGVPHVLEHSVLCGSKKYPVKEPFVDLLKGSLQNFLNAFTYPDRTCYPVASTNTKDFYNLIHVYLDAVLHPRATSDPQVLQQEGWHYELEQGISGPLSIKGVVYNEMKGVYSSPDSLMSRAIQQALFPDNTYGVDSGGDPLKIPDLTFSQFKAFHAAYYHPSNSRIFFYGDDDPLERLALLDDYLKEFDAISVTGSQIKYQSKFTNMDGNGDRAAVAGAEVTIPAKRVDLSFPVAAGTDLTHMVTLNWLLNDSPLSAKDSLALGILDYLLLGTSSSALRKALIESGFGQSIIGGGLSDELLQATFSVGMKGVKVNSSSSDNITKIEALIHQTLQRLAQIGFEEEAVQAAVNTFEFRLREFNTGSFPKGLSVMLSMMPNWIYENKSPLEGIRFEAPLRELKEDIKAGRPVFQELLRKYFVFNSHMVAVEMHPDATLETVQLEAELNRLAAIKANMTEEELLGVQETANKLREAQEAVDSPAARATLPKLNLLDIDPLAKELPIKVLDSISVDDDGVKIVTHELTTSGILYADVAFDYSDIDENDLELLPLFARMLQETGTTRYDLTALTRRIGANTGGISISYHNDIMHTTGKIANPDDVLLYLMIRGKAVEEKIPILFDLFADILMNAQLNNQQRAIEMLKESKSRKEASLLSSGHSYAATRLAGRHSFLGYLNEITGGLSSVRSAGALLDTATNDWSAMHSRLENMRRAIIKKNSSGRGLLQHTTKDGNGGSSGGGLIINLTGDAKLLETSLLTIKNFVSSLPVCSSSNSQHIIKNWVKKDKLLPLQNEAFIMPSQVNYVVQGGPILQPGDEVRGSYVVAARHLSNGYLWDQVRVLGGAYGGFARFSETTGRFSFLSYRDPNCIKTLNVYDSAAAALLTETIDSVSNAATDNESGPLLQTVIGAIGELDAPLSADQKGFVSLVQHLSGETAGDRQQWRTDILNTKAADFRQFAELLETLRHREGTIAVFGSQQAIEQANAELPIHRKMIVDQALQSLVPQDETNSETI